MTANEIPEHEGFIQAERALKDRMIANAASFETATMAPPDAPTKWMSEDQEKRWVGIKERMQGIESIDRGLQNVAQLIIDRRDAAKLIGAERKYQAALQHLQQAMQAVTQGCAQELNLGR